MRLKDADALIDALEDYEKYPIADEYNLGIAKAKLIIEGQPTAYDVDKVVADIEKFADCKDCRKRGIDKEFYYGQGCKACAFGKILDIVKRGGTE